MTEAAPPSEDSKVEDQSEQFVQLYLLTVYADSATDLINADYLDKSDPYVEVTLFDETWKTKVIQDDLNPVWNEQHMFVTIRRPDIIKFHVWDEDGRTKNDTLGEAKIEVQAKLLSLFTRMEEAMRKSKERAAAAKSGAAPSEGEAAMDTERIMDSWKGSLDLATKKKRKGKLNVRITLELLLPLDTQLRLARMVGRCNTYQKQIETTKKKLSDAKDKCVSLNETVTSLESSVNQLKTEKQELQNQRDTLTAEKKGLESELQADRETISVLKENITKLDSEIAEKKSVITTIEGELSEVRKQMKDKVEEVHQLQMAKQDLSKQVETLGTSLKEQEKKVAQLTSKNEEMELEKNIAKSKVNDKQQDLAKRDGELKAAKEENDRLRQQLEEEQKKNEGEEEEQKSKLKEALDRAKELKREVETLREAKETLEQAQKAYEASKMEAGKLSEDVKAPLIGKKGFGEDSKCNCLVM